MDDTLRSAPNILLKPIDESNWKDCAELSVASGQESFVAENWYSLLEWKFSDNLYPFAIYNADNNTMVGFLMYGLEKSTHRWELNRFMIDDQHQRKGYGKAALLTLLDTVRARLGSIAFYTSVDADNEAAERLYLSAGFEKTGEVMWEEDVMRIIL